MGRVNFEAQQNNRINHFSHPHPLELIIITNHQYLASCSGCKILQPNNGSIYTCKSCNFFLHTECSQMPQQITHPFDKQHTFTLFPKPIYPDGNFNCDACGEIGDGFSYHCQTCGTDLHILCAFFPICVTHWSHHHQLELQFSPPYPDKSFCCDICKNRGANHWLYRCQSCGFDAHMNCTKSQAPVHQNIPIHNQNPTTSATTSKSAPQAQYQPSGIGQQLFGGVDPTMNNNDGAAVATIFGSSQGNEMLALQEMIRKQTEDQQQLLQTIMMGASVRQNQEIQQQILQSIAAPGFAPLENIAGIYQNILATTLGGLNSGGGGGNSLQALSGGGGISGASGGVQLLQSLMGGGNGGLPGLDLSSLLGGLNL